MAALVPLSETDVSTIRLLREKGVLQEIRSDRLPCTSGTIVVACSDGHHFGDFYEHHRKVCRGEGIPMHHPLSLCGGALLIPEDSPLLIDNGHRSHDDEVLLRHLRVSYDVKQATTIILAAHAPCGMARACNLSIMECLELLVSAKDRVRGLFDRSVIISGHFHVFYPDGRRLSYHLDRPSWNAMKLEQLVTA